MRSKGTAGVHPVLAIPCSKRQKQLINLLLQTLLLLLLSPEEANAISVEQCCRDGGVPDICARTLCNPVGNSIHSFEGTNRLGHATK